MTAIADRVRAGVWRRRLASAAYPVLLLVCTVLSLMWLAVGAVAWVAAQDPSLLATLAGAADEGNRWARGILAAVPTGGPTAQGILDYAFSVLSIVMAGVLIAGRERSWSTRLLVFAMLGSAGAFNLQAHAAATAVGTALGLQIGTLHQVLFHGVTCAAYILALLVFPPDRESRAHGAAGTALVLAGIGTLLFVGFGTALLPHTISCVLFFGFLVPLVGLAVLPRQVRGAPTVTARTQARLLFSVLAVAFAIAAVLAVITVLLWLYGWGSMLLLSDPMAGLGEAGNGEPFALLFWFSRLASIAIPAAVFVATRRGGLWNAERLFSRGLAAGLTAALVGGVYVVLRRAAGWLVEDGALAVVLATVPAALALRLVYVRAERLADRLLFGARPTPYSVLAGVTALSRVTATDAPDLARVAEAVGRGLGATTCRLTVTRPGLRDRSYTWTEGTEHDPDELVEVVVRHGSEAIGTLAVDYDAVAGLQRQRQHLLEDVADSLGVVLQASRYGIELERQLRAALAHASEIAASRRAVVAEMDGERRRIERDLHDGAQHHLVSLRLTLGLVEHQVSTAQFGKARERIEQVAEQIDIAESILAETAMGVSSPLLAEVGLVRALEKELASGQPPVAVDACDVDDRFPHDVESAVYFCCLEAVNNARKHAPGATIDVRLCTEDGRLRFTVQDDGPGWDQCRVTGSPGRGLRNVTARISAVGGRIEVRSAPGQGTTVEGSVPLPRPAEPAVGVPAAGAPVPAARPTAPALGTPASAAPPLVDQVRAAVAEARKLYHGTERADVVQVLAEQLDAPLRIAVSDGGGGSSPLVPALAALDPDGAPTVAGAALVDAAALAGRPAQHADAFVLLLRPDADGDVPLPDLPGSSAPHRPAHAIGALLVDGPVDESAQRAATDRARDVRRLCHVVVPVAPALARAGVRLSAGQHRALQVRAERGTGASGNGAELSPHDAEAVIVAGAAAGAGRVAGEAPPPGGRRTVPAGGGGAGATSTLRAPADARPQELPLPFEPAVVRFAVAAIRSGRSQTRPALAGALVEGSGLPRLRELVAERFTRRADALKARSALLALEDLVRREPPPVGGGSLRYRLERIHSGAHELTELDVMDALWAGDLDLPDDEHRAAERLLGAAGTDPRSRLGLAQGAGQQEVLKAAAEQLARWHRRAANPLAGVDLRKTADVLVQVCERLLVTSA
jgi:signal transduction histidine kinase